MKTIHLLIAISILAIGAAKAELVSMRELAVRDSGDNAWLLKPTKAYLPTVEQFAFGVFEAGSRREPISTQNLTLIPMEGSFDETEPLVYYETLLMFLDQRPKTRDISLDKVFRKKYQAIRALESKLSKPISQILIDQDFSAEFKIVTQNSSEFVGCLGIIKNSEKTKYFNSFEVNLVFKQEARGIGYEEEVMRMLPSIFKKRCGERGWEDEIFLTVIVCHDSICMRACEAAGFQKNIKRSDIDYFYPLTVSAEKADGPQLHMKDVPFAASCFDNGEIPIGDFLEANAEANLGSNIGNLGNVLLQLGSKQKVFGEKEDQGSAKTEEPRASWVKTKRIAIDGSIVVGGYFLIKKAVKWIKGGYSKKDRMLRAIRGARRHHSPDDSRGPIDSMPRFLPFGGPGSSSAMGMIPIPPVTSEARLGDLPSPCVVPVDLSREQLHNARIAIERANLGIQIFRSGSFVYLNYGSGEPLTKKNSTPEMRQSLVIALQGTGVGVTWNGRAELVPCEE